MSDVQGTQAARPQTVLHVWAAALYKTSCLKRKQRQSQIMIAASQPSYPSLQPPPPCRIGRQSERSGPTAGDKGLGVSIAGEERCLWSGDKVDWLVDSRRQSGVKLGEK